MSEKQAAKSNSTSQQTLTGKQAFSLKPVMVFFVMLVLSLLGCVVLINILYNHNHTESNLARLQLPPTKLVPENAIILKIPLPPPEVTEDATAFHNTEIEEPADTKADPLLGRINSFYDTKSAPTPARLRPDVIKMAQWLKSQNEYMGAKIVEKIYGKTGPDDKVTLYLVMSDVFSEQSRDIRRRTAISIWRYWSFRSRNTVKKRKDAHIVLLNNNEEIIGCSKPDFGRNIWVKE